MRPCCCSITRYTHDVSNARLPGASRREETQARHQGDDKHAQERYRQQAAYEAQARHQGGDKYAQERHRRQAAYEVLLTYVQCQMVES